MRFLIVEATMPERLSLDEAIRYAGRAVQKVDLLGPDDASHCSMLEVEGLAVVALLSGLLPAPGHEPDLETKVIFKSRRTNCV